MCDKGPIINPNPKNSEWVRNVTDLAPFVKELDKLTPQQMMEYVYILLYFYKIIINIQINKIYWCPIERIWTITWKRYW